MKVNVPQMTFLQKRRKVFTGLLLNEFSFVAYKRSELAFSRCIQICINIRFASVVAAGTQLQQDNRCVIRAGLKPLITERGTVPHGWRKRKKKKKSSKHY